MPLSFLHVDRKRVRKLLVLSAVIWTPIILFFILFPHSHYHFLSGWGIHSTYNTDAGGLSIVNSQKPLDIFVVGLVFFGRRDKVKILACYLEVSFADPRTGHFESELTGNLQRNLVDNDGWLDEVHLYKNTKDEEDLRYLEELMQISPRFKIIESKQLGKNAFEDPWSQLQRGRIYVKFDDDVVWMADDAIEQVVRTKVAHPEYFLVSANVINSPLMGWVHYRMGAIHPYLPEYPGAVHRSVLEKNDAPTAMTSRQSWKYTEHAMWQGPQDWSMSLKGTPPFEGHRWLRLQDDMEIHRTPISKIEYGTYGTGLYYWTVAAQQLYSLLENILDDKLHLYKTNGVWITDYERLSINMVAVNADEVLDHLPMDDVDEEWLTTVLPKRLGKSVAVATNVCNPYLFFSFPFPSSGSVEKI